MKRIFLDTNILIDYIEIAVVTMFAVANGMRY